MFLSMDLALPLSSYAFPCFSCWHYFLSELYILQLVVPWQQLQSCASVRGVLDSLLTHFFVRVMVRYHF